MNLHSKEKFEERKKVIVTSFLTLTICNTLSWWCVRQILFDIFDDADTALDTNGGPYLFGKDISYVDITLCSLIAPLLGTSIVFK
jgi:hypothetical protein